MIEGRLYYFEIIYIYHSIENKILCTHSKLQDFRKIFPKNIAKKLILAKIVKVSKPSACYYPIVFKLHLLWFKL